MVGVDGGVRQFFSEAYIALDRAGLLVKESMSIEDKVTGDYALARALVSDAGLMSLSEAKELPLDEAFDLFIHEHMLNKKRERSGKRGSEW